MNSFPPVIDFHAHIYPEKIAARASASVGEFYGCPVRFTGLREELLESGSAAGVVRYIVHSTATRPEQVVPINDYILGEVARESRFIGFGTVHPAFAGNADEIGRIKAAGLVGIKLHPDFQRFEADSPLMDPVYEQLSAAFMPVLFHAGDRRYDFSGPRRIARVLDRHPGLIVIAAHFGGYTEWKESFEILAGRDLYFDTSSTLWKLEPEQALSLMVKHGVSRFLFGSDFPMWDHAGELARIRSLGLSPADEERVLFGNACDLLFRLGIDVRP